jgi:hypothetical protein
MPKAEHSLGPPDKYEGLQNHGYLPGSRQGGERWRMGSSSPTTRLCRRPGAALSHWPQCGSGKFTEYRKEQPTAT